MYSSMIHTDTDSGLPFCAVITQSLSMAANIHIVSDSDPDNPEGNYSATRAECKQMLFVQLVEQYPVLMSKSQLPTIKAAKERAVRKLSTEYQRATGSSLSNKQLMKKLNNMNNEVKVKLDIFRAGNTAFTLKEWENLLLDLMLTQNSSMISGVKGAVSDGEPRDSTPDLSAPSASKIRPLHLSMPQSDVIHKKNYNGDGIPVRPLKKRKVTTLPETEETLGLSTVELQRLVLLEQLKLVRMQQRQIGNSKLNTDG